MTPILIAALAACIVSMAYLYADLWQTERRAQVLRQRYCDAMHALAARQNDIDARDAEIERLRRVRSEYIEHLVANAPRSARELRRETWEN
jgi:hypothetical protein